ncbi:MAG: hypothetical protein MEP57_00155 [Microvirga sp.]|nr:hypothetical protein [Microvirga sp.]
MSPERAPVLADSVTRLGPEIVGAVLVTGSHGGVYAAWLARKSGARAAIFNDAGIGLDRAGIGGLDWLDAQSMAAAAVAADSAEIGDARAMLALGRISHVNARAAALGAAPGMSCADAAHRLAAAATPRGDVAPVAESRRVLTPFGAVRRIVLIDSASLVAPEDAGHIVVTGSHGALFGGDPMNALKVDAALALFNDAGGGVGVSRLPALQGRGIAAATVAAMSARIGDATSTYEDGVISAANEAAIAIGARIDMRARDFVDAVARA